MLDRVAEALRAYRGAILVTALVGAAAFEAVSARAGVLLLVTAWVAILGAYAIKDMDERDAAGKRTTAALLGDTSGTPKASIVVSDVYALQRRPARTLVHLRANARLLPVLQGVDAADRPRLAAFLDRFQEIYAALLTGALPPPIAAPLLMDVRRAILEELFAAQSMAPAEDRRDRVREFANISYEMLEVGKRVSHRTHPAFPFPNFGTKDADAPFAASKAHALP